MTAKNLNLYWSLASDRTEAEPLFGRLLHQKKKGYTMKRIITKVLCVVLIMSTCVPMSLSVSAQGTPIECVYNSMNEIAPQSEEFVVYDDAWFYLLRTGYSGYEAHYTTNFALESGMGYIYNQNTCPQFLIGSDEMADVGCEIAAVYNAIKLRGLTMSCSNIIRSFEKDNYLMARGYLGSDPYAIGDYFANNIAYQPTEYTDFDTFNDYVMDNITDYNVYIVSYWNDSETIMKGLHTVCFYSSGGNLYVYNLYKNSTSVATQTSLSSFVDSEAFIVGYFVPRMGRMKDSP